MAEVSDYLQILGFPASDRITGFSGVAASVCFDLYGCIQVVITPPVNDKGEAPESRWFDIARVATTGGRVMEPPARWTAAKGPAEKPASGRRA